MPGLTISPPFPDDVPTHPLLVIDYQLLRAGDQEESDRLWKAATELGFWYLKNHVVNQEEVDAMFDVGKETLALPLEEKLKFEHGDQPGPHNKGFPFGYRAAGTQYVDDRGTLDVTEFLNVSRDDALAWPIPVHRTYPSTVNARMESTIKPFVQKSMEINNFFIDVFNDKLGLPKGTLAQFHKVEQPSGSTARIIRAPPQVVPDEKMFLVAHTDFGSLAILHNRLGGLQVLPPDSNQWFYVKPLPGHAICNIGDTLNMFSGGILRSNIHRVIPPPKEQAQYERLSLVYFTRPNYAVKLCAQADKSPLIAEAVAKAPPGKYELNITAQEWLMLRVKSQMIAHYNNPESRVARRGTEDTPIPLRS